MGFRAPAAVALRLRADQADACQIHGMVRLGYATLLNFATAARACLRWGSLTESAT
jgi:hypothetical protein